MPGIHRLACVLVAAATALPFDGYAGCTASSGPQTAALVELYTSEGCSSCPPADRFMRHVRDALDPSAQVVPLALHVGYWDYIGWKDPYAQSEFGERQQALVRAGGRHIVYTPQFFVSGTEVRSWRSGMREAVRARNAMPAAADIRVRAEPAGDAMLDVSAEASVRTATEPAALYVALAESGLVSHVTRGENSGETLAHDHVAREWIGPVRIENGAAKIVREVKVQQGWQRERLEVIAFVQSRQGRVLQAVSAQQCARP